MTCERSRVRQIAERGWHDLVRIDDYFGPVQEFCEVEHEQGIQRASLIVALNPELHTVGNFIVRAMFQRIDGMMETLSAIQHKIGVAMMSLNARYCDQSAADEQFDNLHRQYTTLREICCAGTDVMLRDACTTLTQVFAAFHPSPQLDWLGLQLGARNAGLEALRGRLKSFENGETMERIVGALATLKLLHVEAQAGQSSLEAAIAAGQLVIDERQLRAFWKGQEILHQWNRRPTLWRLLVALANKARRQASVDEADLYGDDLVAVNALAANISRLKLALPSDLRALLVTGTSRSYRLDLEAHRIHVATGK